MCRLLCAQAVSLRDDDDAEEHIEKRAGCWRTDGKSVFGNEISRECTVSELDR